MQTGTRSFPTVSWEFVRPETAEQYLKNAVPTRSVRIGRVRQYASDMRVDQWLLNGETIAFDKQGRLINGTHRCTAIVEANVGVWLLTVRGVEDAAVATYDSGATRTAGDVVGINGIENKNVVASIATTWWYYQNDLLPRSNAIPSRQALLEVIRTHPVQEAASRYSSSIMLKQLGGSGSIGFALGYILDRRPDLAEHVYSVLESGYTPDPADPLATLRNRLITNRNTKRRARTDEVLAWIIKAVNAKVRGNRIVQLSLRANETYPKFEF